jgi:hypothetical protein
MQNDGFLKLWHGRVVDDFKSNLLVGKKKEKKNAGLVKKWKDTIVEILFFEVLGSFESGKFFKIEACYNASLLVNKSRVNRRHPSE